MRVSVNSGPEHASACLKMLCLGAFVRRRSCREEHVGKIISRCSLIVAWLVAVGFRSANVVTSSLVRSRCSTWQIYLDTRRPLVFQWQAPARTESLGREQLPRVGRARSQGGTRSSVRICHVSRRLARGRARGPFYVLYLPQDNPSAKGLAFIRSRRSL